MTFEQAQQEKEFLPSKNSPRGFKMEIFIVPALAKDLIKYLKDFENKDFIDEEAEKYSSNNEFGLYYRELK